MLPPASEPFFLLDQNLSHQAALLVSEATGHLITTVRDEWPERDLNVNPPLDEDIVSYLSTKTGHRGVWITQDWRARRRHRNSIVTHGISVLWLRGPGGRDVDYPEQCRMLAAVMETVRRMIVSSDAPVCLRVRLEPADSYRTILERLQGTLLDIPLQWEPAALG